MVTKSLKTLVYSGYIAIVYLITFDGWYHYIKFIRTVRDRLMIGVASSIQARRSRNGQAGPSGLSSISLCFSSSQVF